MQKLLMKYSGIIAIAVLWLSVGISLLLIRLDILGELPLSYLGVYEQSKYIFNIGLIASALLLLVFLYDLNKKVRLSKGFKAVFITGQLCQIIVALTPYDASSIIRPIHVVAGFSLAITLPLGIWLFSRTPKLSPNTRQISLYFFWAELVLFVIGISWFIFASSAGALSEILTAVAFDIWIVVISLQLRK